MLAFHQRSSLLVIVPTLLFLAFSVQATPNTTPGTINCTDLTKNRVLGFQLLDGSNNPLTQTVVTPFFNSSFTIDLNDFVNCDLNVRAVLDTPVPANCDINNIRCVRMTFGNTTRRDFSPPFTVFLTKDGSGRPIDVTPVSTGLQVLNACPYTDPSCSGRRPRCFQVPVTVIACRNPPPVPVPVKVPTPVQVPVALPTPVSLPTPVQAPVVAPTPVEVPMTLPTPVQVPVVVPTPFEAPVVAPTPVEAPVVVPIPVEAPVVVPTPVETPMAVPTPVETPVAVPIPVKVPVALPTPVEVPVPVPTPVEVPVLAPTPVEVPAIAPTPVEVPVLAPTPVVTPVQAPVPVVTPVTPPTPVEVPVTAPTPVKAPVAAPSPVVVPISVPVSLPTPVKAPTPVAVPVTVPVPSNNNVCVFTINQAFGNPTDDGSFPIDVTIAITQLTTGVQFTVTESDVDSTGDLRGLFFDVSSSFPLGPASAISGPDIDTSSTQVSDNNVINLGNGANMNGNGNKKYDVGVEIGSPGVGGGDDFQTTVITVAWPGLTLAHLCGQAFGVRLTTSGPNGNRAFSSKIFGQSCACTPSSPAAPVPVTPVIVPTPVQAPVTAPIPVKAPVALPTPIVPPATVPTPVKAPVTAPSPVVVPVSVPVSLPTPVTAPTPVAVPVTVSVPSTSNVCTFTINQAFGNPADDGSFPIDVTIGIAQLTTGVQFTVTESDADSTGDLRGLFFDVSSSFSLGPASAISGPDITSTQVSDNNVINLGNGANMNGNGNKNYDVGVEIGSPGVGGGDDFQTTVITVAWPGLTLAHLCGQAFGVRLTTSGPNGNRAFSSKIYGQSCACPPMAPVAPVPVAPVPAPVAAPKAMNMRK